PMLVPQAFLFRSPAQERAQRKRAETGFRLSKKEKRLAATYSRASYTGTTIGKTVFDGRVRDGIGSDHSFMATKKCYQVKCVTRVTWAKRLLPHVTMEHL